ncbi:hypothetical protein VHEMI01943 [[Torrubiella] hemipterigena]|uniref:Serine peptidase n=1 Tax=[Torrubiella] hemipterigena TaxID=1531966 RepID=A0A0A1SN79_9HYPO|nr:hypothetical protein VHEMI01943 [[Torrubiella] hemipterigena]
MRVSVCTVIAELLLAASGAHAMAMGGSLSIPEIGLDGDYEVVEESAVLAKRGAPAIIAATFDQLIDHTNPSLGTFKQRYWVNPEFWAGPGSPIVLNAPTEAASDGYLGYTTNRTLPGEFAQRIGGATVLLEHRYWGDSSPYDNLTTTNLQQLNLPNSIADLTYFAKNVRFAFDLNGTSTPDKAAWVLSGCSYPGALTAFVHNLAPGTFWAYHASSAVVQSVDNLAGYWDTIEAAMPRNCSTDVKNAIRYIDNIMINGTAERQQHLKERFGYGGVKSKEDFVASLVSPYWTWQSQQFYSNYSGLNTFCDYVENRWPGSESPQPGEEGVGTCKAIKGMAKYYREIGASKSCATKDCVDSHNPDKSTYTNTTVRNTTQRQWQWMLCNVPFKFRFGHNPNGKDQIISTLLTEKYYNDRCPLYFPREGDNTYGIAKGLTAADVNRYTGGWDNVDTTRLMWANGELDPWRPATVSSLERPGGVLESTEQHPVRLIPKAAHCNDLIRKNALANEGVFKVYFEEAENMQKWVKEFYEEKGIQRSFTYPSN